MNNNGTLLDDPWDERDLLEMNEEMAMIIIIAATFLMDDKRKKEENVWEAKFAVIFCYF